ncbi:hypothetical protein [Alicyclobacillus kakegawensis]|uniref:hypothetical protein n=1 Tax=Alicyclobacillus kakegawensis TaxID=392012 RepID=UPI0014703BBE|nr:hypothetical protein [Alicyclobacillus kakegawensis]
MRSRNSQASYRQTGGIFSFAPEEVHGLNKKYQELYDRVAPVYNLANKVYHAIKWNGEKAYRKVPWMRRYFSGRSAPVNGAAIAELLPDNVADVRLKDICGGRLYCLTFRKIG